MAVQLAIEGPVEDILQPRPLQQLAPLEHSLVLRPPSVEGKPQAVTVGLHRHDGDSSFRRSGARPWTPADR
jgi:hypothetical protein